MEGPASDRGVNFRSIAELFAEAAARAPRQTYSYTVSMLEVYNETVRDLLGRGQGAKTPGASLPLLDIRLTPAGISVPGLTQEKVSSVSEVEAILQRGSKGRAASSHDMNEHSSRSHLVVTVQAKGVDNVSGVHTSAKLHLVDLAGSERLSKTRAKGVQLKEAQSINKSLSALGAVVAALVARQKKSGSAGKGGGHVPFRNSKLTFLL